MGHRYFTLDVFTQQPLAGNQLAVVLDADDLGADTMQAIAAEFALPETVFLTAPANKAHNGCARIFTPVRELPFAGHPTVGAAVLLAHLQYAGNGASGREQDAMVLLEEEIGLVRAGVRLPPDGPAFAVFDLPKLPADDGKLPPAADLAHAIGVVESDIGFDNHRPMRASAGVAFVFVPVRSREALARSRVNRVFWQDLFADAAGGAYVYCNEPEGADHAYRARMFAPGMGIVEDPATGAAAAAFAAVVARFDPLGDGEHRLWIEQGYEMGRPSQIMLEVELARGALKNARIGGYAVIVREGELRL